MASPRLSSAIIGIAFAVTLVPPLATTALLGSRAHWALAQGAFLMAFINMVAIQVGASATLWLAACVAAYIAPVHRSALSCAAKGLACW